MNKSARKEKAPDLRDQGGVCSEDEEIKSLVTKLMTYLKVTKAQNKNPESYSPDYNLVKVGEGRFSDVFVFRDKKTKKEVAVKIFKDTCKKEDIEREVSMLEEMFLRNPFSKFNVKFLKQFEHDGQTCLVFEKLEMNLNAMQGRTLLLEIIRTHATQLFLALDEYKAVNILHADIHPGNIMYVNRNKQDSSIKLIDFGMAKNASDAQPGMELQTLEYRAPEIFLGLPFTEAIDLWGVGCYLAYMYLGHNLFSASSEDQMVERIVELLGQPEDHLLRSGKYTQRYFMEDEAADDGPAWRLREPGKQNNSTDQLSCLDDLIHMKLREICKDREYEDRIAFVDLLKQLLHVDGNQRISARQALKHPFITMDHLINHFEFSSYLVNSKDYMEKCPALSEYLKDKSENWTPFQEFPVVTTHWDQEGRIILPGSSSSYTVLEKIGEGFFNYVVRCQNNTTKEEVAVKIPKYKFEHEKLTEPELSIMKEINARNPASNYVIKFIDRCEYRGRTCLVFEMLDRSLEDEINEHGSMSLHSIRPIAKQVFLALDELKAIKIQHNDLHEGNVMFVNRRDEPHRLKLIDFGSASKDKEDLDEAVDDAVDEAIVKANPGVDDEDDGEEEDVPVATDILCVGEILLYLYLGYRVCAKKFDIKIELGLREESESEHSQLETVSQTSENNSTDQSSCLEDVVHVNSTDRDEELEDRIAFADLLKQMLHFNAIERISLNRALQHPFITMDHLINHFETSDYLDASQALMNECPVFSTDTVKSSSGFPPDQKSSGSPDGVPVTSPEGAKPTNPDVCPSIGEIPPVSDKDNSGCLSGGGLRQSFNDEDLTAKSSEGAKPTNPDVCPSNGEIPPVSDKDNSGCLSGGGLRQSFNDEDLTAKSSEGAKPTNPDVCPSIGEIPPVSDKDNSGCLSGGGLRQSFNDEDLTAKSSEGAKPTDFTPDVSASSGGLRKLLQRIHRFFHRVKKSDRKIPTVPDETNPDVCPSNGEIPPVSDKDNSGCLSGGGLRQSFNDEDLTAKSSEGAKPTDFTPDVSASSGGLRKLLKRISRLKNYLCCCLHPDVED